MSTPVKSSLTSTTDSDSKLSLNTIKRETQSFPTPFSDKLKTLCTQYEDSRDSKPILINSWPKAEKLIFPKAEVEPVTLRSLLNSVKVESIESRIVTNLVPSVKEEGRGPIVQLKDQRANNDKCSNGSNPNLTSKTSGSGGVQLNDYSRTKSTINVLKGHEKMLFNRKNNFSCQTCGKCLKSKRSLEAHLHLHFPTDEFTCDICGKLSPSEKQLKKHKTIHSGRRYECQICLKSYTTKESLAKHKRSHQPGGLPKEHLCEICGYLSNNLKDLKFHNSSVHLRKKRYICEICGGGYLNTHKFTSHMASHSEDKRFICEVCDRCFKRRVDVKHHIKRVHPETMGLQKPKLQCSLCEKVYTTKDGLTKHKFTGHMVTHSKEKRFICELCDRYFKRRLDVKHHIKRVHPKTMGLQKPKLHCSLCEKAYTTKEGVRKHMVRHSGERKFVCDLCGKRFMHPFDLSKHKKSSIHNGKWSSIQ